ncbi:Putative hydro-lyase PST_2764 [Geodia barretti]|uniref:Hydro-lyase PST_2764 n=1 Tax=Geodia barretti TaxID=519541 RepID=A0AA35TC21_GEOBA|nr:Putative hydro-lyase PST_2764 [Geodia barretti]
MQQLNQRGARHMTLTALPTDPAEVRELIRDGRLVQPTAGFAPGRVQANLAILPRDLAFDFLLFCQRNPKPCPLLEVIEPGEVEPSEFAPGADIRSDIALYRIYEHGEMTAEVEDISEYWRDDLVSFLLGCSFSFETAMSRAGIPLKHIDQEKRTWPMVVSMRAIKREQIVKAVQVTSRFPATHGAPIHIGNPEAIGITDIYQPDFGEPTDFEDGEVPVFWACGVTPQAAAMQSRPPLMITHAPGHMFVTDKSDEDMSAL